jgi:phosphatidate cytidylyltransferase
LERLLKMATWKNFLTRAASAIGAIILLVVLYKWLDTTGLKVIAVFGGVAAAFEVTKILFKDEPSASLRVLFFLITLFVFASTSFAISFGTIGFTLAAIAFTIFIFVQKNRSLPLDQILSLTSKGVLGFFYAGLLPAFCYKILDQDHGTRWFVFLLATVLVGDTFAYLVGVFFGKSKIMPTISPKKSWQGSFGGVFGSVLAGGLVGSQFFSEQNLYFFLLLSVFAGITGQFGDFFESLLKRIANVKDSGKIMPGHGGVLDRIDGILFAGPIVLMGALILSHMVL